MQSVQEKVMHARAFAICAHGGQKYGDKPYVVHLDAVAEIVRSVVEDTENAWIEIVAYLHDVVEDTEVTVEQIRNEFDLPYNTAVSQAVSYLTDEPGQNRKERKRKTYAKLKALSGPYEYVPCLVKLADRLANVRECVAQQNKDLLKMYQKEHALFREAVYRPGLAPELMVELDDLLETT